MAFTYKQLDAWTKSMALAERCYRLSGRFPAREMYGLSSQLRRAAVSIPSNLAEGHCRRTTGAFLNHISIALGSYGELETCVEIAQRLQFIEPADREQLTEELVAVGQLLYGLHAAIERKIERA